ncbi:MAG: Asp-tRNA(Asn)/Glu-tRNA(Gln) amidotransferase GatCAB subunit C [Gammaproteobacteria bacterium]|jgi:aspartyl-tRNA(Asn)/glutamyl-tRNA(Gln) amidotransferase subunit C|nr:Asp-tRNA(Asn)/Glu-tRNA(Gln) amidotransferase GatCAB subunit C [Gammaproteobacteria bacterium]MCH2577604.1 Asp-tRNA(Asn)/Glu-tRNA(Gln) amidotransferase subunit GatC [Pseudomonadales bacterium]MEC7766919.1 Asp-tRNA(Asn)/Glu-tRNA(Gln) amidotransferase subunit GatC [Pseudomonadota bacterium]MBC60582.1 Asp-tRNA(Asn)/Glu-tRNA(Gln) amidotransferase GatCAB subunit C [Gammaproteobacteria bacterium]MBI90928.1 Asp-tRNA(Asn)/Glu-tRNA(Gln) amidotransferase GatCAB subunit C [Gammaproteobacteria bacterium]|tara:strand:- start:3809 stop:4096 length:288 start_codon:yes stop_codon:yes gene_type:complete
MALDKSELEKIAHLARLHITKAESEEVMLRITDILALIDEMQSINTNDVAPLAHPLDLLQRLRTDEITERDYRDELQSLAPEAQEGLYLVPKVIE